MTKPTTAALAASFGTGLKLSRGERHRVHEAFRDVLARPVQEVGVAGRDIAADGAATGVRPVDPVALPRRRPVVRAHGRVAAVGGRML